MSEWLSAHRYQIDKLKIILKFLGNSAVAILIAFLLLKTFYLNRPKLSPLETAISFLKLGQSLKPGDAKKYLASNIEKIEILGEKYASIPIWVQQEKSGEEPTFKETPSQSPPNLESELSTETEGVKITLLEKTKKNEGLIFLGFKLPKEIVFEIELVKEGDWKQGYSWKIVKIDSSDLVFEKKLGEETEIRENVFIKPVKIEEHPLAPDIAKKWPDLKILTLEIEYKNSSNKEEEFYPFSEWRIVDSDKNAYNPPSPTSARFLPEPTLLGGTLKPGEIKKGYIPFEIPKEVSPEKIIFKDLNKKLIFQLTTDN